jgi:outer membrane protein TolC
MLYVSTYSRALSLVCAAGLLFAPTDVRAQTAAATPAPAPATVATEGGTPQPPVLRFDPAGISVADAVRLAIEHNPDLQLRRQAVELQQGIVQEQRGVFDLSLLARGSYEYRVQELSKAKRDQEVDKRETLRQDIEDNRQLSADATRLLSRLRDVQQMPDDQARLDELTRLAPELGVQLNVINRLIATAPAGARAGLEQIRADVINRALTANGEDLSAALAQIAGQDEKLRRLGEAPIDEVFTSGRVRVQLSKLFRTGITLTPYIDGAVDGSNYKGKGRSKDDGGKGLEDLYSFHTGASLNVPLLRGRGRAATGAFEQAAILERSAAQADFDHQAAVTALDTVLAYWDLRAAQDALGVAQDSLTLQSQMSEATRTLIEAGEVPGVEGSRADAALARAQGRVADADRRVLEARVALALAMGVAPGDADATLPRAASPFPQTEATLGAAEIAALSQSAVAARKDVEAASRRVEASGVLEQYARTNLRPLLDVSLNAYYTALGETSASNALDRFVGPSTQVGLTFEKPFGNNVARGQLASRRAEREIDRIRQADLQRQIRLGLLSASGSLPDAVERLRQAQLAGTAYESTVQGELERFRVSESTLIDTVVTEQQRTEARLALVDAQRALAEVIALLRFQSGMLVVNGALAPQTVPGK